MYFVFKRVLLHISTHVLAPRHSFSYTSQKVFLKDELFSVNMLHYFLLVFIFKMKNGSRGTSFTSTKHTLSLFWLQEAREPCLSIESPAKNVQFVCFLFDLILYVPSTIFQLYRDGSSWVEPVLS